MTPAELTVEAETLRRRMEKTYRLYLIAVKDCQTENTADAFSFASRTRNLRERLRREYENLMWQRQVKGRATPGVWPPDPPAPCKVLTFSAASGQTRE